MASGAWHQESLHWANYAYQHLLAPQVKMQGRIAIVVLCGVVWAFGWLLWRAYSVIQTPNDLLVEKLGLDIPPTPKVTLEEISSRGIQIGWKPREPSASILEYEVEVNGQEAGKTRKTETACVLSGLVPGAVYDIRVFCVSAGRFKTPSSTLHVRLPHTSAASSPDGNADTVPTVRAIAARPAAVPTPPLAPAMAREHSGGQPAARRGTINRKPSPAGMDVQMQHLEHPAKTTDDELDGNLVELSQRFQEVQQQVEAVETQIQEEDREYEAQLKDLECRRDKLKQHLKKRDEESSDLRKQVHKAETQNRALLSDKTKKERELQLKENERKKKRDEIAKWEEQIATMAEEIAGIETQKAAIQRRAQSEIGEIRDKIEEEQKEVAILEHENREKAMQIQILEQERKELNFEDDTDETREAERLQNERTLMWRQRFSDLQNTYTQVWYDLQQINSSITMARQRLVLYENARRHAAAQFVSAPLDPDAARRGILRPIRRTRPPSSHASSSISSPRPPYSMEPFQPPSHFTPASNVSPTTYGLAPFNPVNGMTYPSDIPISTAEESDTLNSVPMSPHAEVLLPADLLGDESADEIADDGEPTMPTIPTSMRGGDSGLAPFPKISSPTLREDSRPIDSPSAGSSSGRSFSSPLEAFASVAESDQRSTHSRRQSLELSGQPDDKPSNSKRLVQNLFSFNTRARGKTSADQGPALGTLTSAQSQSFPRNFGDADQPRRRQSYGGNWAFPSNFLLRGDKDAPRLSPGPKVLPSFIPALGKSSDAPANYDPFTARANSLDPGFGGRGSDSPRPASIYSFDKMPRPSVESQLRAWSVDKSGLRSSPLVPDWGSLHSFSLNHSRRPSVQYGSTSNISLPVADEHIIESRQGTKPLQAPIGTRPASSHRPVTPKLNPAAPSFTMLFKSKSRDRSKLKEKEGETSSPAESRKSKDAPSLAATTSTTESRESLHRSVSQTSNPAASETAMLKPTLMSRISRKANSNKFGSWKDKGSIFLRKDASTPTGDHGEDEMHNSTEHLGRSLESMSTTPNAEDKDKKASRTSLGTWSFMRAKSKRGPREDLTASEVSENSERASEISEEVDTDNREEGDEGFHLFLGGNALRISDLMANSKYEYVRTFEREEMLLPSTWIVVRIDGRGFHKLSKHYSFAKPNDAGALGLMNAAASHVLRNIPDIFFAYGVSDEFSFVFERDTNLFERRRDKLVSTVVSTFTAAYVALFNEVKSKSKGRSGSKDDKTRPPLDPSFLPTFDSRAILYPSIYTLRDYLSWRQVDCHINNLYNTTFWALAQQGAMGEREAEEFLQGTVASEKNEILWSRFGVNYNNEPEMYRKGSVLFREYRAKDQKVVDDSIEHGGELISRTQQEKQKKAKAKSKIVVKHCDIIKDDFWNERPWLLLARKDAGKE
ncbi:hypothetical protein DV736_g4201, partial [Chaetothyriales sp. CBS 134916]